MCLESVQVFENSAWCVERGFGIIMALTDWNLSLEEAMDNGFRKIGVIDYQKSKYANLFIIGSFVLSISVGAIIIILSDSTSNNILKGQWILLGCLCFIIIHESVHLIFMKIFSKERLCLSFKFPTISVGSNGKFSKRQFIIIALAPVVILGVVLALLIIFCSESYKFFLSILLILNFAGSGGDYLQVFEMRKYSMDTFFQDNSIETSVYKKK